MTSFRTYLTPKHLAQCPDVVRSGVDVFGQRDRVDGLAYTVPEGGFEALLFFGVGCWCHDLAVISKSVQCSDQGVLFNFC